MPKDLLSDREGRIIQSRFDSRSGTQGGASQEKNEINCDYLNIQQNPPKAGFFIAALRKQHLSNTECNKGYGQYPHQL
jgi:hypothetical protein